MKAGKKTPERAYVASNYLEIYEWKSNVQIEVIRLEVSGLAVHTVVLPVEEILQKTPDPIPLEDFRQFLQDIQDGTLKPIISTVQSVEVFNKL